VIWENLKNLGFDILNFAISGKLQIFYFDEKRKTREL